MKKSLPKEFLEDIIKLPYKPNPQDNPQHENQIEELLIKHKIKYVDQPNGSQSYPDFALPDHDLDLECKSVKDFKPMWNRGLPRQNALYIISSKKLDRNSILFGKQILSEVENLELIEMDEQIKKYAKKKAKKFAEKHNSFWTIYPRLAYDNNLDNVDVGYEDIYFDKNHVKKVFEHFDYKAPVL
tara:strand:+ start:41 stop:595 length:555 start_codon:yes stop_codon:yes gene_type:complete